MTRVLSPPLTPFVDALPLTASGKVRKNVLRDQLATVTT